MIAASLREKTAASLRGKTAASLRAGMVCVGLLAFFCESDFAHAGFEVPALTGPVIDSAGMLDADVAASIDITLRRIRDKGGPQINVLTVPNLGGLPIETAAIQVTDKWKLGGQKADDGVLLLVALEERKIRIEVGQGLEGVLTDLDSKQIIADKMTPYFRAGRASDGIVVGVREILAKTAPDAVKTLGEEPQAVRRVKHRERGLPIPVIILILVCLLIFGRRGGGGGGLLAGALLGSVAGRGGWGGSSRGGSSWSGGGGGFSGGGASGGW